MKSTESIRVEMQGGLAILTLDQAARGNPFDGTFTRDFREVASDLCDCTTLRAVLLRADGANYSFGGDLKAFHPVRDRRSAGPPVDGRLAYGPAALLATARARGIRRRMTLVVVKDLRIINLVVLIPFAILYNNKF